MPSRPFYDLLRWLLVYLAWGSVCTACIVTVAR